MLFPRTLVVSVAALLVAVSMTGCGDCSKQIAAADAFLANPDNLRCQTTSDCVVVNMNCHTPAGGLCGQAALSSTAAASSEWKSLRDSLNSCTGQRAVCAAALVPACSQGLCR